MMKAHLISIVVIAISVYFGFNSLRQNDDLERLRFSERIFAELIQNPKPVIVTGSPIDNWDLPNRWTEKFLRQKLPKTLDVKIRSPPIFVHFDASRPLANYLGLKPPYKVKKMSTKKLFSLFTKSKRGVYYNDVIPSILHQDLPSAEQFYFPSDSTDPMIKIWIGNRNITANQHYDATHNFFHQIKGKKQFLLFPPDIFSTVQPFSSLHPSHRQSQSPNLASPLKVILNPGDVLYIPPFWFHHVTTLEPSISLNIWSNSHALNEFQVCLKDPVPYLAPLEKARIVTDGNSNLFALQTFLRGLLEEFKAEADGIRTALSLERVFTPFPCADHNDPAVFTDIISRHRKVLEDACFQRQPSNIRIILLSSYLESVSALFIQPDRVRDFLHGCIF